MNIKQKIVKMIGTSNAKKLLITYKIYRTNLAAREKRRYYNKIITQSHVYRENKGEGQQYYNLFTKCKLRPVDSLFYYSVDFYSIVATKTDRLYGNLSIDYNQIMDVSLDDLKDKYSKKHNKLNDDTLLMINGIENLCNRIIKDINKSDRKNKDQLIKSFNNIKSGKIETLFDAFQKILFYNQLEWQTGIDLVGLGRLDVILDKYYNKDKVSDETLDEYISNFYLALHSDVYLKSSGLVGDTGQLVILGGIDSKGKYFANKLTYEFIKVLKKVYIPEPKILLRVSENMPDDLLKESIDCICTGIGSPLFANDDVIIPKLKDFGFAKESYDYITSACWEPLLAKDSSDQNNCSLINFLVPFNRMLDEYDLNTIKNKEDLLKTYKKYLNNYLDEVKDDMLSKRFSDNLLLSMVIDDCYKNGKNLADGGAKNNNYGFTSVGMSNVVNSILNINYYVFDKKKYSLTEMNDKRKNNYVDSSFESVLKNSPIKKYGSDDKLVLDVTNKIMEYTNENIKDFENYQHGKLKFGLSSPSYIMASKTFPASLDGRKEGDSFGVHISSTSSDFIELFNFCSKLEYGKYGFNGNVIDFIVSPSFIKNNYDKFILFMKNSIKNGFFEMQMNVIDSKTLIAARENPKLFPNLIVRVWGFSAYFNELPLEYKNLLIERALASEKNNN